MDLKQTDWSWSLLRDKIEDAERRTRLLALQRELSVATKDLFAHPGWAILRERCADMRKSAVEKLTTQDLAPYHIGLTQGFIRALDAVTGIRTLTPEELDSIEQDITMLQNQLAEWRKLQE